jgi:hypothetical protein
MRKDMGYILADRMTHFNPTWSRLKRYARLWLQDVISQTIAPLTDSNARLNYLTILVVVLLVSPRRGPERQLDALISLMDALEAGGYSLVAFFALNMLFSVFRVRKSERDEGQWTGTRFVYHEPVRLFTALVDERDNGVVRRFDVVGPEDDAFVSYVIETDRSDRRAKVELAWPSGHRPMETGVPMNLPKGGFRLPTSRQMALLTHVEPASTVTTVRVYMTHWEVGPGDGRG